MPALPSNKPYRIGRSRTGLGLFATQKIRKGSKIVRYFGPMLDSKNKKHDAIDNKYLFEITKRWTIDGSVRKNTARYINHACKPNAESDVSKKKLRVEIRAIKTIHPGEEINYDYGTDYFKEFLKPIGCKCVACEKKRKRKRAEARDEKLRLKLKAKKKAAKRDAKTKKAKKLKSKTILKKNAALNLKAANAHARGTGKPSKTKSARTKSLITRQPKSPALASQA